jgi:hypothetical protein
MQQISQDGVVGIVTRLRAGQSGVRFWTGTREFLLAKRSRPDLRPRREVDHSHSSGAKVMNEWSSIPPYAFISYNAQLYPFLL